MGTVFRKTYTVPLPAGAELFEKSRKPTLEERAANSDLRQVIERFARWKDKRGKIRTAKGLSARSQRAHGLEVGRKPCWRTSNAGPNG